jgi:hypothetical protein
MAREQHVAHILHKHNSHRVPIKIIFRLVYVHKTLTVNGILNDCLKKKRTRN